MRSRLGATGRGTRGVALVVALLSLGLGACTPPEELDANDLEPTFGWDDLLEPERPGGVSESERIRLRQDESDNAAQRAAPRSIESALARVQARLDRAEAYEGGILGRRGTTKVFVASRERIKDFNHLYWVQVKVLSEKYGCLMVAKARQGLVSRVRCRDGRQVVFWQSRGKDWIQFRSRQFDAQGYEIDVRNRRIVRLSDQRMI